jgi:hypothetical protein
VVCIHRTDWSKIKIYPNHHTTPLRDGGQNQDAKGFAPLKINPGYVGLNHRGPQLQEVEIFQKSLIIC